jgi:hypothetical protein
MNCKIHLSGSVWYWWVSFSQTSVAAYVFGPPGSGSVSASTDPDPSVIKHTGI